MTKERAQMIAMRLADKANRMVKTGELSRFQARFYLREASGRERASIGL